MNQEQLRNIIRDLHNISHKLAEIQYAIHGEDGKKLEHAKADLTTSRVQLLEHLEGKDGY